VRQLRESLLPDVLDLVQRQRINFMNKGTLFDKYRRDGGSSKSRGRRFFLRLSANRKALHYGEWTDETTAPKADQLPNKLPLSEVRDVAPLEDSGLSINRETGGEPLEFTAPDARRRDLWWDGLSALLRKDMRSGKAAEDVAMLLDMEVRIRLLDLEGVDIPDEPPPIPPPPADFNFAGVQAEAR